MRGLVFEGVERIVFARDLPEPEIEQPTDVLVEVDRAGICGSDLHQFHGRESVAGGTIPGHEFAGEVVAVGASVRRFHLGDSVFSPFTTSCGDCFFCRDGLSARCCDWQIFGYQSPKPEPGRARGLQGAQAELVRVPLADSTLLARPDFLTLDDAILLGDNFTTGYYCASLARIRRDGLTVVIGCGSVGLSAIVAARSMRAENLLAVDPVPERRSRAASLGADTVHPDQAQDAVSDWSGNTGREGADSILEAVGNPSAQELAFQLVRPGGVIAAIGVHTSDRFAFSPAAAHDKNVTYTAGRCPVRSLLNQLLPLVESDQLVVPSSQIVTQSNLPLEQGVEAYHRFSRREGDCVKVILDPKRTFGLGAGV